MIFYILNSNQEIVETIQSPDTDGLGGITALKAIVDEKLDTYELLEVVVPADADGLEKISENMTLIFEDISGWREYYIYEIEDEDGSSFTTSIRAELGSSELMDDIMEESLRGVSRAPETVLGAILKDTRYSVGHVDSSINTQDFNIDTEYMNILELLNEYAGVFGAELRFSYQVDGNKVINRFVNVYKTYGEYRGKVFEIDRDMTSINRTVNTELIKTTIIPYSQEIEVENEDSNAPKETCRIDITDLEWSKALGDPVNKPKGQNYLVNEEVLNTWGTLNPDGTRRHKKISMEFDLDNAEAIASMAWVQLGRYAQPRVNYEVDGIDLYAMTRDPDLEHEKILLGDTLGVKDHYFAKPVNIQTRLVELERDLFDSRNNQYTFGTSKQLFSANASADKAEEMIKDVEELIKNMEDFQTSVDGSTKVFRGSNTPVDPTEGDLWFRPHPVKQGHTQMLLYTGVSWSIEADSSDLEDASRLKFGIIDGAEINVINLIADNITGGQLKLEDGIEITNKGQKILSVNSAGEVEMNISKMKINAVDLEEQLDKINEKADIEATNAINEQLGGFITKETNDEKLGEITTALNDYLALVDQTRSSVYGLVDDDGNPILDEDGEPIQEGVAKEVEKLLDRAVAIEHELGQLSETWSFDVSQITMAEEGMFVGSRDSDMGILIAPDRIVNGELVKAGIYFMDGGNTIAFISGQMMQINRGIFVQSATIGEHKIETIAGGHTIFSWKPS